VRTLFPPPLPVSEFPKFKEFVRTTAPRGYPCDTSRWPDWIAPLWTLAHAAGAALSRKHALRHPGRFAESAEDEEESALRDLLARFNSHEWGMETDYLVLVPGGGDNAVTFTFDEGGRGLDEAAWTPDCKLIKCLNTWCRTALDAFSAAQRRVEPNDPPLANTPTPTIQPIDPDPPLSGSGSLPETQQDPPPKGNRGRPTRQLEIWPAHDKLAVAESAKNPTPAKIRKIILTAGGSAKGLSDRTIRRVLQKPRPVKNSGQK